MKKKLIIYSITLFLPAIIGLLAIMLPSDDLSLFDDTIYELSGNFQVGLPDGSIDSASLPVDYDVDVNKTISLSRTFEDDFPEMMSLRLRSSMQYMEIYVDEELIFNDEALDHSLLQTPEASAWHIIQLPGGIQGKTLKITISSPVGYFSGMANPIYYGHRSNLIFELISRHFILIVPSFFLLLMGLVMFVANFFLHENADNRLYYLSLFTISTNLWMLSEMDILQLFTGNRFIVGGISYILIPFMCASLLLYLAEVVLFRYKNQLTALSVIYVAFIAINLCLQLSGRMFFINSLIYVHGLILLTIVAVIGLLIYDALHHKDKTSRKYILFLGFFLTTATIEVLMFLTENFDRISSLSSIGFLVFLVLLIFDSIHYFNEIIAKESETKLLRKLAYMDILTKGHNRAAFEREIDKLLNTGVNRSFRLVSADLNNLKLINDRFGHLEGDYAITSCYKSLNNGSDDEVLCYRLGGDEFACIIYETDYKYYHNYLVNVENMLQEFNIHKPYDIEMAVGTGIYSNNGKETFEEFMHRVDLQMYENKRNKKNQSKLRKKQDKQEA